MMTETAVPHKPKRQSQRLESNPGPSDWQLRLSKEVNIYHKTKPWLELTSMRPNFIGETNRVRLDIGR